MIEQVSGASPIRFSVQIASLDGLFSKEEEISLYRIVQEGVNNIIKHSHATDAQIEIGRGGRALRLVIVDNGYGCRPESAASAGPDGARGFGLTGMAERVAMLGGEQTIESTPGRGTKIVIHIPLRGETGAEVAVLDIDMPNADGFEVVRRIRETQAEAKVIFLTMHKNERFLNAALDLGVQGYILKDSAATELIVGIKAVAAGEDYLSPALSTWLVNRIRRGAMPAEQRDGLGLLTPTERRVLRLVAACKTSREIAEALYVSARTVEHHRANICAKLGLKGVHALIRFAAEHRDQL